MEAYYFTATWCQPCKVFGPVMEKIGKIIKVTKIDINEDMSFTVENGVMSVPTVVFFKDGMEQGRLVGAQTEQGVLDYLGTFD